MELGFEGKAVSSQVGYWYELADLSSAVSERLRDGGGQAGKDQRGFQTGEIVLEKLQLKVSGVESPGEWWHRTTT